MEPWTFILISSSILLFVIGQQKLSGGVNALVQILLAVSSGVLGARVTNLVAEASGQGILTARGKVAVRGLKLMLVQTAAFERRLHRFLGNREHIRDKPEVTERNYEESIEFCKRIQEEAASAMETWGDIVPTADFSSLIGRITEAEERLDVMRSTLVAAQENLQRAEGDAAESEGLRSEVAILKAQVDEGEKRVSVLNHRLARRGSTFERDLLAHHERRVAAERAKRVERVLGDARASAIEAARNAFVMQASPTLGDAPTVPTDKA